MTSALLLDTHIALWFEAGSDRLRPATWRLIDDCWQAGGTILLSAVSAWELALLVAKGRLELDLPVPAWVERWLERPGFEAVPLTWRAAARGYSISPLDHGDPADRLLIATAIELGCPLVTYDERIARFAAVAGSQCGFAIAV